MSWQIDFSHSEINFKVRHMMITHVHGVFNRFDGSVNFDEADPAKTTVDIKIEMDSIDTRDEKRDAHLRSADFFDVEKYPTMTFKSTKVEMIDETSAKLTGDLTIRDVTRPVTLNVEFLGKQKAPWGVTNAGFSASSRLNRKDFGLNWNVALESGGWLVGDTVEIAIELELHEVVAAPAAGN